MDEIWFEKSNPAVVAEWVRASVKFECTAFEAPDQVPFALKISKMNEIGE